VPKINFASQLLPITREKLISKKRLIDLYTVASCPIDVTSNVRMVPMFSTRCQRSSCRQDVVCDASGGKCGKSEAGLS
jgi:hypothetical protein